MSRLRAVLLDGIAQIEFDRAKPLPDYQGAYLDKMDRRMDAEGIDIDGHRLPAPDPMQKARFIAVKSSGADLAELGALAAEGKLRTVVDSVFPLAELGAAHRRSETGRAVGKVLVEVCPECAPA